MPAHTLHIVIGPPGAGKSTYARKLAQQRGAVLLDIDTVTEPLIQASLKAMGRDPDDRDSPFFKQTYRDPIYQTLFQIARDNLAAADTIIVGPFTSEQQDPDWKTKLESQFDAPVEIHFVNCSPETRRQRLAVRNNPRDQSKLADWPAHLAYYPTQPPACPHHKIQTD